MPGDALREMSWWLSGGSANSVADLSLGGARSSTQVREVVTLVTANAPAGATRVYHGDVRADSSDRMIYFRNGNSGLFHTRIVGQDVGSGWVDLLDPLPDSIAIDDGVYEYGGGAARTPFGFSTAQESLDGFTQYCGLYLRASTTNLSDFGVYIDEINPGPLVAEICVSSDPEPPNLLTIPDRWTEPDLSVMIAPSNKGAWLRPLNYESRTPIFDYFDNSAWVGLWIKLTSPPNALRQSDQVIALVSTNVGQTIVSKLILHLGTAGFVPDLTLKQSPTIYLRGGARFRANVKNADTGLPIENVPVRMLQKSGPGTFTPPADPSETDADGNVVGHYTAPTDVGEIGETIEIEAEV